MNINETNIGSVKFYRWQGIVNVLDRERIEAFFFPILTHYS